MSNLRNLQGMIIEMTQTKHENRQTTDTYFFEKSFIDRSVLVLKILKVGTLCPTPISPMATQVKKAHGE